MIEVDKILHNTYDPLITLNLIALFDNHSSATLGHDLNLTKKTTDKHLFQHFSLTVFME